jgi:hypothetical protein
MHTTPGTHSAHCQEANIGPSGESHPNSTCPRRFPSSHRSFEKPCKAMFALAAIRRLATSLIGLTLRIAQGGMFMLHIQ